MAMTLVARVSLYSSTRPQRSCARVQRQLRSCLHAMPAASQALLSRADDHTCSEPFCWPHDDDDARGTLSCLHSVSCPTPLPIFKPLRWSRW